MTAPATLLATLSRRPATAEPDAELLGRFLADADSAAFAELVHRYARLVWRVARTRCRTDATAEDVFQATFAVLNRKAKAIRTPPALAGWLHLTAHRLAIRATRRERPTVPLPPDLPRSDDPLDTLTARELLSAVDDELANLNDSERAVLLLCGLDGVSNGEAAARLGVSAGSVKGRLERARGKLRDRLSARGLAVPSVLAGLVGLAPPASAVDVAVLLPAGGALSPAAATLISETLTMKTKAALAAVAGLLLLTGSVFTDSGVTPKADAAPVPREFKPPPKEAWGEAKDGLQAGLRMPDGVTVEEGADKVLQVAVRNVGRQSQEVRYTPQQRGVRLGGVSEDGRVRLGHYLSINGRMPEPVNVVLKPGEEFVRWRATVRHAPPDDRHYDETEPRLDLPTGTHRIVMNPVGGDLVAILVVDGKLRPTGLDALATGELEVKCVLAPRKAPVPKEVAKVVLWSEPVRVDWKGSRVEHLGGTWTPDGVSVLVPGIAADEMGKAIPGGGVDFRNVETGTVTATYRSGRLGDRATYLPTRFAVSPDGKKVIASGVAYETGPKGESSWDICVWQGPAGATPGKVTAASVIGVAGELALAPDGVVAAVVEGCYATRLFDVRLGLVVTFNTFRPKPVPGHAAVAFYPNGRHFAVVDETGDIHDIDAATGKRSGRLGDLGVKARAVAVSPDGKSVAVGGEAGEKGAALITLAGGPHTAKLIEPQVFKDAVPAKERINGLGFSPDGKHLAAACSDGFLRVFDVATGKATAAVKEHKEEIFSVAYSPDGKKLLTVGRDAIKVWDVAKLTSK